MKIRHPLLIRVLAFVAAWVIRCWMATVRYRLHFCDGKTHPTDVTRERYLYAFWHESLLFMLVVRHPRLLTLISQHADGELIARACQHLGLGSVRGSATRGGAEALLKLIRLSRENHLAFTPDGPRGPRRQVPKGVVFLASQTGLPIVPVGVGCERAWRMRSWDRFMIPRPGASAHVVLGQPITVPSHQNRRELERYRQQVEQACQAVTEQAEQWAITGTPPGQAFPAQEGECA
jgi:lysophospholipid acyltransferase (LPLAT)-like uncharacterized protein